MWWLASQGRRAAAGRGDGGGEPLTARRVTLTAKAESWPIAGTFNIARGAKTQADVVVATVNDGAFTGQGECVPYPRYGETVGGVVEEIEAFAAGLVAGAEVTDAARLRGALLQALPAGAARNAVDCALWDLQAKQSGRPVWELAGVPAPPPVVTAYTLSLGSPAAMGEAARRHAGRRLLKVKLGGGPQDDIERLRAVRRGAPAARLIVDANEGWSMRDLRVVAPAAAELGVALIEQPLPAAADDALIGYQSPVPLGADESCHGDFGLAARSADAAGGAADAAGRSAGLATLAAKYAVLNVKLDKAGGLTSALALAAQARSHGVGVMIGCMVATSLAMAPALLLADGARFVDLDGPLLLAQDRPEGLVYAGQTVALPPRGGWGRPE